MVNDYPSIPSQPKVVLLIQFVDLRDGYRGFNALESESILCGVLGGPLAPGNKSDRRDHLRQWSSLLFITAFLFYTAADSGLWNPSFLAGIELCLAIEFVLCQQPTQTPAVSTFRAAPGYEIRLEPLDFTGLMKGLLLVAKHGASVHLRAIQPYFAELDLEGKLVLDTTEGSELFLEFNPDLGAQPSQENPRVCAIWVALIHILLSAPQEASNNPWSLSEGWLICFFFFGKHT